MTAKPTTAIEREILIGYKILPHPDGKPWKKCCTGNSKEIDSCQCFMKKPPKSISRFQKFLDQDSNSYLRLVTESLLEEKGRFFCCHRLTEDGYHRECAGWAAKITGNK